MGMGLVKEQTQGEEKWIGMEKSFECKWFLFRLDEHTQVYRGKLSIDRSINREISIFGLEEREREELQRRINTTFV